MLKVIKNFTLILMGLFLFGFHANAEQSPPLSFDQYSIKVKTEKAALTEWVEENAQASISVRIAKSIVHKTYDEAARLRLDPLLAIALMRAESGFRPKAKSKAGAKGLTQVMPRFHKDKLAGRNPYDIDVSIEVGLTVLRDCLNKHKGVLTKALNCYSGGAGKRYYKTIADYNASLSKHLVQYQFLNEKPIFARHSLTNPVVLHQYSIDDFQVAKSN